MIVSVQSPDLRDVMHIGGLFGMLLIRLIILCNSSTTCCLDLMYSGWSILGKLGRFIGRLLSLPRSKSILLRLQILYIIPIEPRIKRKCIFWHRWLFCIWLYLRADCYKRSSFFARKILSSPLLFWSLILLGSSFFFLLVCNSISTWKQPAKDKPNWLFNSSVRVFCFVDMLPNWMAYLSVVG